MIQVLIISHLWHSGEKGLWGGDHLRATKETAGGFVHALLEILVYQNNEVSDGMVDALIDAVRRIVSGGAVTRERRNEQVQPSRTCEMWKARFLSTRLLPEDQGWQQSRVKETEVGA